MANKDNPRRGAEFEKVARREFERMGFLLTKNFEVVVGASALKKPRKFDLGSSDPPILVECKRNTWTKGDNAPSAKMSVWNEAMYYFSLAPKKYRKVLFVLKSSKNGETLADYYLRRFEHLIPPGVEIWECDYRTETSMQVFPASN